VPSGWPTIRRHLLDTGKVGSLTEIAAAEGMDLGQVSRIARLARLAPWVVEACVAGKVEGVTLEGLFRRGSGGRVEWAVDSAFELVKVATRRFMNYVIFCMVIHGSRRR
jgi:hypothetical protein